MRGELPGVGHLMEDQPAAQILGRQLSLTLPLLDVRLDEVEPLPTHWLGVEQLGVVLPEDAATHEGEHEADVAVDTRTSCLRDERIRHAAGLQHRVDHAAQYVEVQVEPPLAIEGVERRHGCALRKGPDQLQQRLLELGRKRPVAERRRRKAAARLGWSVEPGPRRAAHLVPVEQQGGPTPRPDRLGHGRGGEPEQDSVDGGTARGSPHRTFRVRASRPRTGTRPRTGRRKVGRKKDLVDVGPVAVSLKDDLAAVAAKHDLDVPPPDRLGVSAADGAGGGLFHVHRRDRVDLDF